MALREVCWELKEGEKWIIQGVEQEIFAVLRKRNLSMFLGLCIRRERD